MPRIVELIISLCVLFLVFPLFPLIMLAIKLESPGPVFFKQIRIGYQGVEFNILKFRSMRADNHGLQVTAGGDRRITSVGRVLRKTKLDELPQLLNVIKGDMALVGPRPEVPEFVACYPSEVKTKVLSVKPGITDRASLEYVDEESVLAVSSNPRETYIHDVLPRKLAFYQQYVDERSFLTDMRILFATIRKVIFRTGS